MQRKCILFLLDGLKYKQNLLWSHQVLCIITLFNFKNKKSIGKYLFMDTWSDDHERTMSMPLYCANDGSLDNLVIWVGTAPLTKKLACFVLYLKIINNFLKMLYASCSQLPKELKNGIKI